MTILSNFLCIKKFRTFYLFIVAYLFSQACMVIACIIQQIINYVGCIYNNITINVSLFVVQATQINGLVKSYMYIDDDYFPPVSARCPRHWP